MKIMSRNFSTKEKALLVILAFVLVGLVYYKMIYANIHNAVVSAQAEVVSLQTELETAQAQVATIERMKSEMDAINSSGAVARMGSYNNSKPETAFLHTVLSGVADYSIKFDDVTRDGDQIRRNFNLQYKTNSYKEAEAIMKELTSGEYRCLISDVNCNVDNNNTVTISLIGTFYETMVGGTADSALPKDESETVEIEEYNY